MGGIKTAQTCSVSDIRPSLYIVLSAIVIVKTWHLQAAEIFSIFKKLSASVE